MECRSALGVYVKWYVNGSTIGASDHGKITVTRQTSRNSSWFSWLANPLPDEPTASRTHSLTSAKRSALTTTVTAARSRV